MSSKLSKRIRQIPKQHYVYLGLFLISCLSSVTLHRAGLTRCIQSVRDLGTSIAIYFLSLFDVFDVVPATIMTYDFPGIVDLIGFDVDDLLRKLSQLFPSLFVGEHFFGYLSTLSVTVENLSYILMLGLPILFAARSLIDSIYLRDPDEPQDQRKLGARVLSSLRRWLYHHDPSEETDPLALPPTKGDSKQLTWFKGKILPVIQTVTDTVADFWEFGDGFWHVALLLIWAINLNVATILISALGAYFYILGTFEISALFYQLAKLLIDLLVMFLSAPALVWSVIGFRILTYIREYIGDRRLQSHEQENRSFIDSLPLSSLITGWMAAGKTATVTDIGLTFAAMLRDKALEFMYGLDLAFPEFPWRELESWIEHNHTFGTIKSLVDIRDFFDRVRDGYADNPVPGYCFGYDPEILKAYHDNGLMIMDIFDAMCIYAQLYLIYHIDTSLIVSSYAVRSGLKRKDTGHFPLFDVDFFDRESYDPKAGYQMSHIIDYDMFRLGKKVDHRNPNVGVFEFGTVLMSEKGKERGNAVENQHFKKDDPSANPKNDLFDLDLKMRRHAATVNYYTFAKFISDEQRPESVGANEREVSQVIHMDGVHKEGVFTPFFTLTAAAGDWILSSFKNFYYQYRNLRSDQTLMIYLLKHFVGGICGYVDRYRNLYGFKIMQLRLEDGTDGEARKAFYTISKQKLYSGRYSTDCLQGVYVDKIRACKKSLPDLETYENIVATPEELQKQHSYFVRDVFKGGFT